MVYTDEELRVLIDSDKFSFRFDCGICQPSSSMTVADKEHIMSSIALHYCFYSCKVELDEIRRGLLSLGFLGLMAEHPILQTLFKHDSESQKLTVEVVEDLFEPMFSPEGSNSRVKEQQTMMHFLELLHELEGGLSP